MFMPQIKRIFYGFLCILAASGPQARLKPQECTKIRKKSV